MSVAPAVATLHPAVIAARRRGQARERRAGSRILYNHNDHPFHRVVRPIFYTDEGVRWPLLLDSSSASVTTATNTIAARNAAATECPAAPSRHRGFHFDQLLTSNAARESRTDPHTGWLAHRGYVYVHEGEAFEGNLSMGYFPVANPSLEATPIPPKAPTNTLECL